MSSTVSSARSEAAKLDNAQTPPPARQCLRLHTSEVMIVAPSHSRIPQCCHTASCFSLSPSHPHQPSSDCPRPSHCLQRCSLTRPPVYACACSGLLSRSSLEQRGQRFPNRVLPLTPPRVLPGGLFSCHMCGLLQNLFQSERQAASRYLPPESDLSPRSINLIPKHTWILPPLQPTSSASL